MLFSATILKFGQQGEKTGWMYIPITQTMANTLLPNNKKSFRVKGCIDEYPIKQLALLPMGDGSFILPLNAAIRKGIKKRIGATVNITITVDNSEYILHPVFMECLADDPPALEYFNSLTISHRHYFSKWIDAAKTEPTMVKRIGMAVNALNKKMGYPEMIRWEKENKLQ
jgi:hypothetical protein